MTDSDITYWTEWSTFDDDGTLRIKVSGLDGDAHWTGMADFAPDDDEYLFWRWVVTGRYRCRGIKSHSDIELLRSEYAGSHKTFGLRKLIRCLTVCIVSVAFLLWLTRGLGWAGFWISVVTSLTFSASLLLTPKCERTALAASYGWGFAGAWLAVELAVPPLRTTGGSRDAENLVAATVGGILGWMVGCSIRYTIRQYRDRTKNCTRERGNLKLKATPPARSR